VAQLRRHWSIAETGRMRVQFRKPGHRNASSALARRFIDSSVSFIHNNTKGAFRGPGMGLKKAPMGCRKMWRSIPVDTGPQARK